MSTLALATVTMMPFTLQPTLTSELELQIANHEIAMPMAIGEDDTAPWRANLQGNDISETDEDATAMAFGTEGSKRWTVKGQWASAVSNSDAEQSGAGVGMQYFIVDDFAFAPELNLWRFSQDDPDAWGVSLDLLFQWHFLKRDTWSVFADFGCGMLGTNNNVPSGGSQFNFTPQAGFGVTFDVCNADARLVLGVKWHHISNASLYRTNPGRDSIEIYAGLNFPF